MIQGYRLAGKGLPQRLKATSQVRRRGRVHNGSIWTSRGRKFVRCMTSWNSETRAKRDHPHLQQITRSSITSIGVDSTLHPCEPAQVVRYSPREGALQIEEARIPTTIRDEGWR